MHGSTMYATLTVTSGREYHIKVTPNASGTGTYRIGFNSMPLPPQTLSTAAPLVVNTWADGAFTAANGEQWFTFTAASSMYLHVFFGTLKNLYVQLYESNGAEHGDRTHLYGTTTYTSMILTSGAVYYVQVTPNAGIGNYRIAINMSTTAPAISD